MNRRDALVASVLAAGLMALLFPLSRLGVDAHHDGIMLKPALDVLAGQVLFRDTFTQYGALTTYLQAAALWIQPGLLSLRFMTVAAYGVSMFFLYAAWRLFLPRSLTIVACGLFFLFIPSYENNWLDQPWMLLPWSSVYALMFQALSLYALLNVIRHEQAGRWGVMLGLAAACVFWCRQPVGMVTIGSIVVVWLALHWTGWAPPGRSQRTIPFAIIGGFFGVHVLILAGIWLSGAGPEWWYQNFVWPRKFALLAANAHWHAFYKMFVHPAAVLWLLALLLAAMLPGSLQRLGLRLPLRLVVAYYAGLGLLLAWQHARVDQALALRTGGWTGLLPLVVVLQAAGSIWLGFTPRRAEKPAEYYLVAAAAALSLSSLVQYYPVPDTSHIMWALAPAFGLILFAFWRWSGWPAPVLAVVLAVAFLPSIVRRIQSAQVFLAQPYVTLTQPAVLRGMKVPPAQARSYGEITSVLDRILKERPDIPTALIGNDALFLSFTGNHINPLPYYVTWAALTDEADKLKRWSYILEIRPLMFFHKANWSEVNDFYRGSRYVPIAYITDEALEIAVPQELADSMGVTTYGAPKKTDAPNPPR